MSNLFKTRLATSLVLKRLDYSDHYISYLVWVSKQPCANTSETYVTYRKSKHVDMEAFRSDLHNQNWKEIEKYCNIDDAIEKWETMLLEVVNRHMPLKTRRVRKTPSPWMNSNIISLMKNRDKIKLKAKRKNDDELWKQYKHLKNKVTTEIRKAKRKNICDKLSNETNRNESWKTLKSLMGKCKSSNSAFPKENSSIIANKLNNHFANVATSTCTKSKKVSDRQSSHKVNSSERQLKFPPIGSFRLQ